MYRLLIIHTLLYILKVQHQEMQLWQVMQLLNKFVAFAMSQ